MLLMMMLHHTAYLDLQPLLCVSLIASAALPKDKPLDTGHCREQGRSRGSSVGQEGAQVEAAVVAQLAAVCIGLRGWPGGHRPCGGPSRCLAIQRLLLLCCLAAWEAGLLQGNQDVRGSHLLGVYDSLHRIYQLEHTISAKRQGLAVLLSELSTKAQPTQLKACSARCLGLLANWMAAPGDRMPARRLVMRLPLKEWSCL